MSEGTYTVQYFITSRNQEELFQKWPNWTLPKKFPQLKRKCHKLRIRGRNRKKWGGGGNRTILPGL